jgi:hypothetical protein
MPAVDASDQARDEITALVHGYAELLDGGDVEGVVAMFARATWRSAATGTVLLVGRYEDEYRCDPDGCYLTDRRFHVDLDASLPRASGDAGLRPVARPRTERTEASDGGKAVSP